MTLQPRTSCRTLRFPSWISRSSGGARLGQLSDLREQGHDVGDLPLLLDLAVATTADRQAGELDVVAGHVPAADGRPGRDVVTLGDLVVDRDAEIGDLRAVAPDHLGQAVGATDALWMQDVSLGEQAGERVEVAGGRLREAVADRGLVLFVCAHDASFAAAARHSIGGTT